MTPSLHSKERLKTSLFALLLSIVFCVSLLGIFAWMYLLSENQCDNQIADTVTPQVEQVDETISYAFTYDEVVNSQTWEQTANKGGRLVLDDNDKRDTKWLKQPFTIDNIALSSIDLDHCAVSVFGTFKGMPLSGKLFTTYTPCDDSQMEGFVDLSFDATQFIITFSKTSTETLTEYDALNQIISISGSSYHALMQSYNALKGQLALQKRAVQP